MVINIKIVILISAGDALFVITKSSNYKIHTKYYDKPLIPVIPPQSDSNYLHTVFSDGQLETRLDKIDVYFFMNELMLAFEKEKRSDLS